MRQKTFIGSLTLLLVLLVNACCPSGKNNLWNGKDFTGWQFYLPDTTLNAAEMWTISDGIIHCAGTVNAYMRTTRKYSNYRLTVEWRWPEKEGNSGVFVNMQLPDKIWPNCMECQLQAGSAGDIVLIGPGSLQRSDSTFVCDSAFTFVPKMAASSENQTGEWNTYTIVCTPEKITAKVNGILQNEGTNPSHTEGYICLQSEGFPIEFRNIKLEPLKP